MFVIIDWKMVFHTQCVGMFMVCLNIEFHMPVSSSWLISDINLNAKQKFCMTTIFLFYILQKTGLKKSSVSLKVHYYASFQDPKLNGRMTSVVITFIPVFVEIIQVFLKLKWGTYTYICKDNMMI
jgi:hypothetical protein